MLQEEVADLKKRCCKHNKVPPDPISDQKVPVSDRSELVGNGRKWSEMVGNGRKRLETVGNCENYIL